MKPFHMFLFSFFRQFVCFPFRIYWFMFYACQALNVIKNEKGLDPNVIYMNFYALKSTFNSQLLNKKYYHNQFVYSDWMSTFFNGILNNLFIWTQSIQHFYNSVNNLFPLNFFTRKTSAYKFYKNPQKSVRLIPKCQLNWSQQWKVKFDSALKMKSPTQILAFSSIDSVNSTYISLLTFQNISNDFSGIALHKEKENYSTNIPIVLDKNW